MSSNTKSKAKKNSKEKNSKAKSEICIQCFKIYNTIKRTSCQLISHKLF